MPPTALPMDTSKCKRYEILKMIYDERAILFNRKADSKTKVSRTVFAVYVTQFTKCTIKMHLSFLLS